MLIPYSFPAQKTITTAHPYKILQTLNQVTLIYYQITENVVSQKFKRIHSLFAVFFEFYSPKCSLAHIYVHHVDTYHHVLPSMTAIQEI